MYFHHVIIIKNPNYPHSIPSIAPRILTKAVTNPHERPTMMMPFTRFLLIIKNYHHINNINICDGSSLIKTTKLLDEDLVIFKVLWDIENYMKYTCKSCKYTTDDSSNWVKHTHSNKHINTQSNAKEEEIDKPKLICKYCKNNYQRTSSLIKHLNLCPMKDKSIINKSNSHNGDEIICEYCNSNFQRTSGLTKHLKVCPMKGNSCESTINLSKVNLLCKYCHNNFKSTNGLTKHLKICPMKDYDIDELNIDELNIDELEISKMKTHNLTCQYCNGIFKRMSGLTKHLKICPMKDTVENELIKLKEELKEIKDTKDHYKKLTEEAGKVAATSVSSMNFLLQKQYMPSQMIAYNPDLLQGDDSDDVFFSMLVFRYRNKTLPQYISDAIIKHYHKSDPKEQTLWSSDVARLNYIISETTDGTQKWVVDKNAEKIRKLIIEPILTKIDKIVIRAITTNNTDDATQEETTTLLRRRMAGFEIHKMIEQRVLENAIMVNITPAFYLDKTKHK